MKRMGLILVLTLCSTIVFSQGGKLKKADNYYEKIAYAEAASIYTELIGSELDSPELKAKLANCYYQMGATKEAEQYYSEMISTPDATSEDVYNYAQSLKENGNYTESDRWMEKFYAMQSSDSRAQQFSKNKMYVSDIEKQQPYFSMKHLSINTANTEFGGYPYGEDVYFVSNRRKRSAVKRYHLWNNASFLDVYKANSSDENQLVDPDFYSKKVNKKYHEGPMCFTSDGKTVYFTRNNMKRGSQRRDEKGIQNLKIYRASIDEDGKWVDEEELSINSKDYSVGHPTLSKDGKTMYFSSDMPGGFGGADIYKMSVNEDGSFGTPENLGAEVNTEGQEMFPWMDSEGVLFFSSDGHLGLGGLDVFAMLPNKEGSFKKRVNIGKPINGPNDDFALVMSKDQKTGYVSSNRTTGSGGDDIYSFEMLRPLKINLMLKGIITDVRTHEILPGSTVELKDGSGQVVAITTAGPNGEYEFDLEENQDYTLAVSKDDYFDNSGNVTTKNIASDVEVIEKDLALEKDPGLALYALITDAKEGKELEGVEMVITDNITGEEFINTITPETGDALKGISGKKIGDRVSYTINLKKEGYFPKTVVFNDEITQPGIINVHEKMNLGMDKEVTDLAELIEINPINFDLNKHNIRPDAAKELDKIVVVMNKYPNMEVELGSHTDCRASKAYNEKLSDRRAKSSAQYIKERITNPERIYGKGYGESRLLNGCECEGKVKSDCSEEEHEKNRRTEFKVISIGDDKVKVKNNSTDSFDKQ